MWRRALTALRGRPALLTVLGFSLALVLFYRRFLFEGLVPGSYDFQNYAFANLSHLYQALGEGRLPLWDPYRFAGVPFLANPQAGVFYPVNLALAWLEPVYALTATVLIHSWIAGMGMVAFARTSLRCGWVGSLVAGLAFAFGGYMAARTGLPNQMAVIAWLPWVLLVGDRLVERPRLLGTGILALLLAFQYLGGHFQAQYIALALCGLYLAARMFRISFLSGAEAIPRLARSVAGLAVATALGVGLGAAQILPTLGLREHSLRQEALPIWHQNAFALPKSAVGQALLPSFAERGLSEEFLGYVGLLALWLAGLALLDRTRRFEAFILLGLAILGGWIALGLATPLFGLLSDHLPGFDLFRVPARWLLLTSFGLAALAAVGTDYATNLAQTRWYPAAGRALATTGAVGASAALTSWGLGWSSDLQLAAWLAGGSVAFLVLRYCAYGGLPGSIVLPGFLIVELILAQHTLDVNNLAAPPRAYLEPGPVAERLERGPGAPRVLSVADTFYQVEARRFYREGHLEFGHYGAVVLEAYASTVKYRDSLSPNQSSALRIPSPDGYGGGLLPLRRYVAFRDLQLPARPGAEDSRLQHEFVIREQFPDEQFLRSLGTGRVIADNWSDLGAELARGEELRLNVDTSAGLPVGGQLVLSLDDPVRADAVALAIAGEQAGPIASLYATSGDGPERALGYFAAEAGPVQVFPLAEPGEVRSLRLAAAAALDLSAVSLLDGGKAHAIPLAGITAQPDGRAFGPAFDLEEIGSVRIYSLRDPADLVELRGGPAGPVSSGAAVLTASSPERMELLVEDPGGGLLVVRQSHYPGWRVRVDGAEAPLLMVDSLYLGVQVPPGRHRVTFEYDELRLEAGAAVSAAAALAVGALLVLGLVRRRRPD